MTTALHLGRSAVVSIVANDRLDLGRQAHSSLSRDRRINIQQNEKKMNE